ncbi:hypothetical protein Scep_010741 [Stephania cephalantha]|uniref:Uncharacterized protein n=1 Tax=Stephania cephalantha TaxID=152367 RepID=A0AAP0JXX1_9MAGN
MAEDEDSSSSMASLFEGMVLFNSSQIPGPNRPISNINLYSSDENLFSRSHFHLPISPIAPLAQCHCFASTPHVREIPSGPDRSRGGRRRAGSSMRGFGGGEGEM